MLDSLTLKCNWRRLIVALLVVATGLYDTEAVQDHTEASRQSCLERIPEKHGRVCCRWESKQPRDCTCGRWRYDIEELCHDERSYYAPTFKHINTDSCDFICENGGTKVVTPQGAQGCNCPDGYHGTCCEIETICGGTFFEPTGEFSTPGYPNYQYPNGLRCVWKIITDPGRRIALSLNNDTFDVEPGSNMYTCNKDWITVYDGGDKRAKRRGPYCGNRMRKFRTIYSTGRFLYVEFITNSRNRRSGFGLQYRTFVKSQECGPRNLFKLPTAIITSPHYPLNYRPYQQCPYEIIVKPNHDLILRTLELHLPARAGCRSQSDVIIVSKKIGNQKEEIIRYCGTHLYSPTVIRGAESVVLEFSSNHSKEGRFKVQYEQIPVDIS